MKLGLWICFFNNMSETKVVWNTNVDAKVVEEKILTEIGKQTDQYGLKPVELILQIHSLFDACLSHLCM